VLPQLERKDTFTPRSCFLRSRVKENSRRQPGGTRISRGEGAEQVAVEFIEGADIAAGVYRVREDGRPTPRLCGQTPRDFPAHAVGRGTASCKQRVALPKRCPLTLGRRMEPCPAGLRLAGQMRSDADQTLHQHELAPVVHFMFLHGDHRFEA